MIPKKRTPAGVDHRGSEKCLDTNLDNSNCTIPSEIFKGPDSAAKYARVMAAFNKTYAVVNDGGRCSVWRLRWDAQMKRQVVEAISFDDLRRMYFNRSMKHNDGVKCVADWWLTDPNRRQCLSGVVFDPTGKAPPDYWNLWRGFPFEPQPGDWSLMRAHICDVICGGNDAHADYLMDWLARMFQHPESPAEVAVVLKGGKGSGKSVFGQWLLKAWGQHGVYISNSKYLVGNFNGHLRDVVFLFADEAFFAGDGQQNSVLKALITEPVIFIEAKYKNGASVRNMLHILMASNNDFVVPASSDERRYFVLDVSPARIGDHRYFEDLNRQMEQGGLAAMVHDLLKRDISGFDHRAVPQTAALQNQKLLNLNSLEKWWHDVLDRGFVWRSRHGIEYFTQWQTFVPTELLHQSYLQWAGENKNPKPMSRERLGAMMKEMEYDRHRPAGSCVVSEVEHVDPDSGESMMKQDRPQGYWVGTLAEARQKFCTHTTLELKWGDETEES
jgi:hypothetical protein